MSLRKICRSITFVYLCSWGLTSWASTGGMAIHGFADVGWSYDSKDAPNRIRGFNLGMFDLYMTPKFGGNGKALIELGFEPEDEKTGVDMERMELGWTFSDALTVWLGRFHTPYGYWNTTYHHGAQFQTAVLRPRAIAFEELGGVLPAHSVGLHLTGSAKSGSGRWLYDVYTTNGSRISDGVQAPGVEKDDNSTMQAGFNISHVFSHVIPGWRIGLHGLTQKVSIYPTYDDVPDKPTATVEMMMYGGYAVYEENNFEFSSEYYRLVNKDASSTMPATTDKDTHKSDAVFAQLGYNMEPWIPFVRYETATFKANDLYLASQEGGTSHTRYAVGFKYDVNPFTALKAEYTSTEDRGKELSYNEVRTQYAIRF